MVQAGELAIIKASGETVFVLSVGCPESDSAGELRVGEVEVRRPVGTQSEGIVHHEETFLEGEVESLAEHFERECQETKLRYHIAKKYSLVAAAPDAKELLQ